MEFVEIRVEARDDDPRARELGPLQQARQDIQQRLRGRHRTVGPSAGPDGLRRVQDLQVVGPCRALPNRIEPREHALVHVPVGDKRRTGDPVMPRMLGR